MPSLNLRAPTLVLLTCLVLCTTAPHSSPAQTTPPAAPAAPAADGGLNHKQAGGLNHEQAGLLNREQAGQLLPATVFYHGQVAPIQARNSAGLRLPGGKLLLVALVDTSGYASSVQQTYQGYLLTEIPLRLGDQTLPAGAYGFGFLAGDQMAVLDLGGTELLRTATTRDAQLRRPTPLQMLTDPSAANRYRLYLGRSFVALEAAPRQDR